MKTPSSKLQAETIIKVPFYDVDSMGIVWHGNYVKYLELARCDLMEKIGYGYTEMKESGFAWPIVKLKIKYISPCFFEDEIKVQSVLTEYQNGLGLKYTILNNQSGLLLSRAETMQFAIDMSNKETCFTSPSLLINKVRSFLHYE